MYIYVHSAAQPYHNIIIFHEKFHGGSEHFAKKKFAGMVVIKLCNSC